MKRLPAIILKPSAVIVVMVVCFASTIGLFEYYDFETKRLLQKNTQAHELLKTWNDLVSTTKDLLIANDLNFARQRWISSIAAFDQDLKRFIQSDIVKNLAQKDVELKNKIEATGNLWYIIKPRIESVQFSFDEYLNQTGQQVVLEKRSLLHELMYQMGQRKQSGDYLLLFDLTFDIEYMVSALSQYFITELSGTIQILDNILKHRSALIIWLARISAIAIFTFAIVFILFSQRALTASKKRLTVLSTQLIHAAEKERKRISHELHDEVGQALTALKFNVENALDLIEKGKTSESVHALKRVVGLIQHTLGEARKLSVSLRPAMIDQLGIIPTISWFCREYQKSFTGIEIEQIIDLQEDRVPQPLKIVLYRVLQEALTNIAKHSNARHVTVALNTRNSRLHLAIEDDGKGFNIAQLDMQPSLQNGFGLMSMRERVELSGGEFEIRSSEGQGAMISASWDLKPS